MAKKIRNIYKGNQPINYIEIEAKEPLLVVATDENCSEAIVYSKVNSCTITITYGTTTLEYKGFQGDTLQNIAATLNESAINTAVTGESFSYWYIMNNGTGEEITPSSSAQIADCLNNVVINGDITITAIYNLNTYKLHVYDYDHTTVLQSITVSYGGSYNDAIKSFDTSKLTSPNIDTKLYSCGHNGWTLAKGSNIQDTSLSSKTIISDSYIYPCYSIVGTITYTMNFHIYSEDSTWQWIGSIELKHNQSYNEAIDEGQTDVLSRYSHKDLGTSERFYNTDVLFFDPLSDAYMTKDTPLENVQNWINYSENSIDLYIGYTDIVKTYTVKLYDELACIYLYQSTDIIHSTKISTIEGLGTQVSTIQSGNYKSSLEDSNHIYTYWLEYSDGTKYNTNDVVTSNIELIIKYTKTPNLYTITFQTVVNHIYANGTENIVTTTIDTTTATYDTNFSLPTSCFKLLNSTSSKYSDDGKYIINLHYASEWVSKSNSSRQFTGNHMLKCIGNEVFTIFGSAIYSTPSIDYKIYDQGILYPENEETLIVDDTVSTISELHSALNTLAKTKGNEYEEDGLYFYNTPGIIKVYCEKIDASDTDVYNADGLEVAEGYYADLPQSLTGVSKIYVYVISRSQCISTVTVKWYNMQTATTIQTTEIQKGLAYKNLTYPSAPSVSGYTFDYWSPIPTSAAQIFTDVTINAYYKATATEPDTPSAPTTPGVYVLDSSGNYIKVISISKSGQYISMLPVSATVTINSTTKSSQTGYLKGTFSILMVPLTGYSSTTSFPRMYITTDDKYVTYRSTSFKDMPAGYYFDTTSFGGEIEVKYNDSHANTQRSMACTIWALDTSPSTGESWSGTLDIKAAIAEVTWPDKTESTSTHNYVTLRLVYKSSQNPSSD